MNDEDNAGAAGPQAETPDEIEQEADTPENEAPEDGTPDAPGQETGGFMKIIITTRNGRTMMGVERNGADPYLEPAPGDRLEDVAAALPDFVQRAREHWSLSPRNPKHFRPNPAPAKKGSRKTAGGNRPKESAGQPPPVQREEIIERPLLL